MKRNKRILSLMAVVLLVAVVLAGCGGRQQESSPSASSAASSGDAGQKDKPQGNVTLRMSWWGDDQRNKATLDAMNLYMKNNPNVKIEGEYSDYASFYQKLVTQLAGGTAPDIMVIVDRWYYDLAGKQPFLKDLGELKDLDFSTVDPEFMKTQLFQGKKIGFPAGLQGATFTYNKDFFKKYNIPEGTQFTWDDILSIGQKVHEQNPDAYLFTTYDGDLDQLLRAYQKQLTGNPFIKDDYTMGFTKEDLTKIFAFEQALFEKNVAEPLSKSIVYGNNTNENPEWLNGNRGMFSKFISLIPVYQQASSFPLGVTALPLMPGAKDPGVFTGSTLTYVINAQSEHAEESAKFINWMVNDPEAVKILGTTRGIPATSVGRDTLTQAGQIDPLLNEALDLALKTSSKILPDNAISQNQELAKIWMDEINKVAYSKVTPEQAADEMIKLFDAKLKELKAAQ